MASHQQVQGAVGQAVALEAIVIAVAPVELGKQCIAKKTGPATTANATNLISSQTSPLLLEKEMAAGG